MARRGIGIIGTGKISGIYLKNLTGRFSKQVQVTAVADQHRESAEEAGALYKVPVFPDAAALIASPDVDIVLNLTPPQGHYQIALDAIRAGKHVYNEKPLCISRDQAAELLQTAADNKVRVGCAPDTFLGAGIQTSRKIINDGWIGKPLAAVAFMMNAGPENWHPNPAFFYKTGAGPLFDVGPYYLTALIHLLGRVTRVSGSAIMPVKTRTIGSEPLKGTVIDVEVPTHVAGTLDFASGVVATIITSFEIRVPSQLPWIDIYGTEGTLQVPDPNTFGGPVLLKRINNESWSEFPLLSEHACDCRGLGITDMAEAINEGRPHLASGKLAYHVLDVMHGFYDASSSGRSYKIKKDK
ncbi:MAG: Gfo/Idh/MocA family oxidoreductase [Treponema sp.]|jgi:predicted dehydrogenase|nr:Gfo/Idh/MocA family oxidoreductase [Treponema sp.]